MRRRAEVVVGAAVLLGLAVIFAGTIWLKGGGFGREEVTIEARFREVGQLLVGNAVKVRGVPIGRVEEILLEPGGDGVVVRMRIEDDVALPQDPVVLLSLESMFGDWHSVILPRGRFPEYDYAEGTDPQVLAGYSLPDISRLTAVADRIAENMAVLSERFELAFTEETALNVRRAVENIQEVSEQLTNLVGAQERAMQGVARDLEVTTRTLGEAAATVRRVSAHVEAAIAGGELASIVDNVERMTAQADSLSAGLLAASRELEAAAEAADSAFRAVGLIAAEVGEGRGTLGRLLQDTVLYTDLVTTNTLLQQLLKDIQANPRKYINLRIF